MPRLTELAVKNAKPKGAPYSLGDGGGLHLLVSPSKRNPEAGTKIWQVRYHLAGTRSLFSAGPYPDVTLAGAREIARSVRAKTRDGLNPVLAKRAARLANIAENETTFGAVAGRWIENKRAGWSGPFAVAVEGRLGNHVYPAIGDLPVASITTGMLIAWIEKLDAATPATARHVLQHVGGVFMRARLEGAVNADPSEPLTGILKAYRQIGRPAAANVEHARELLARIEGTTTKPLTLLAHRFMVLTSVRISEVMGAQWCEFDGLDTDAPIWTIPAERMKGRKLHKRPHVVALSRQAVEVIHAARRLSRDDLIFNSRARRDAATQRTAINLVYYRAGVAGRDRTTEMVPHGWRSVFSTVMNERYPDDRLVIDQMLAHAVRSSGSASGSEGAYNRATFLDRRRVLHQAWADLILEGAPLALSFATPKAGPTAPGASAQTAQDARTAPSGSAVSNPSGQGGALAQADSG